MIKYKRILNINRLLQNKSIFLLGPRQTGKSTFLAKTHPEALVFSLLEADVFRDLSANPELLRQRLRPTDLLIAVDEIQKLPALLDEVQRILDLNRDLRFILTGSSARKLKRGGANLLAGRAWTCHMHPLVFPEIGEGRLTDRINRGSLPAVIDSPLPHEDLKAYVGTYLQEEIRAEALTRSIENFSRFLTVAGLSNGKIVNFTKAGNDAQVPPRTIREYYQVLEDTLLVHQLPPFQKTKKRKPVATSKYYFFDVGVANHLMNRREILPGSPEFGETLEHLIFLELKAYFDYERIDLPLTFWRTQTKLEVDFLLGAAVAVEVKGTEHVSDADLKGLRALSEETKLKRRIVVSREKTSRATDDGIEILPVEEFLKLLWEGFVKRNLDL